MVIILLKPAETVGLHLLELLQMWTFYIFTRYGVSGLFCFQSSLQKQTQPTCEQQRNTDLTDKSLFWALDENTDCFMSETQQ